MRRTEDRVKIGELVDPVKNAQEAISRALAVRGYVVVGIPPSETRPIKTGDHLDEFSGQPIMHPRCLRVTQMTGIDDWRKQFEVLFPGKSDNNVYEAGSRFYRCSLVVSHKK